MTLLSLFVALVLQQFWPAGAGSLASRLGRGFVAWFERRVQASTGAGGRTAWLLVVPATALASAVVYGMLWSLHPLLAFLFNVAVLFAGMGFARDSRFFNEVHVALRMADLDGARALLSDWRGVRHDAATTGEVARLSIEQALVAAHRSVFGVIFWFVLLPGPSGVVLYRLAALLAVGRAVQSGACDGFAQRVFLALDWLPARLTALVFSVVGNFEDAVYCWRSQAVLWPERSSAILIASGGGALGVRLGGPIHEAGALVERPEMGLGGEAGVDHMQGTVGLLWRALLVCLFLLALLAVAGAAGG
ncbi:CobD/CbiB family protein [Thauera sp. AutoDN2]|uniref:CobD/CbiB family protein n=1 Tax=Thauera sp. AutoDN2 TaxID=3416051 RepID=UPI003F4C84DE